ncbi:MAG: hypothetical protein KGI27_13350 [Thaumarchaeota archaeon]|nr:hypothetical protein [Nitrososphaerota archaeon]
MPITMGAAMGNALGGSQQYAQQAIQNSLARENFAYQAMWMRAMGIDPLTGKPLQTPTQQLSDLNQGQPAVSTPTGRQLTDLQKASSDNAQPDLSAANILNPDIGSALQMPVPGQYSAAGNAPQPQTRASSSSFAPGYEKLSTMIPAGMNPYVFMGAMMKDPGRLASTMYAWNPEIRGEAAGAEAAAQNPYKLQQSLVSQLGRETTVNPGEGQIPVSGLSAALHDPQLRSLLFPNGVQGGVFNSTPQLPGARPPIMGGTSMSGAPLPNPSIAGGMGSPNDSVYRQTLQKDLAAQDANIIKELGDNADRARVMQNNLEEMWQNYNAGVTTGTLAPAVNSVRTALSSFGITNDDPRVQNYDSLNKNSAQLGAAITKTISSRPSQQEFKYMATTAIPNGGLAHNSVGYLLGQMDGVTNLDIVKNQYVRSQMFRGMAPSQASSVFDARASATPLAWASLAQNDPQYYHTVYQELNKTATGRAMIKRVDREAAWMEKAQLIDQNWQLVGNQ